MSGYQQDQASWEWIDQEEERWNAENIKGADHHSSMSDLAKHNKEFECLLAQFDSHFMIPNKESL